MTNDKKALSRVDGRLKVTGKAKYSAEYEGPRLVYGVLAGATITKGALKSVDTKKAQAAPGVLTVITHFNVQTPAGYISEAGKPEPDKGTYKLFYSDKI